MAGLTCCVCGTPMISRLADWCFRCPRCGTWGSTLAADINGPGHVNLDEQLRETGLADLRDANFSVILERLRRQGLAPGARLLDVGSAHGWFVMAARDAGWTAEGVEPDETMAKFTARHGATVRVGFFPDVLNAEERFDAICFNDVLEHIPDARAAIRAVRHHLEPGGLLSVNIPNRRGLVYRVAAGLRRLGIRTVFERLWQVGLPSPHVWYFDEAGLRRLCESEGLQLAYSGRLASLSRRGLWQRAHADRRPSAVTVASVCTGWAAAPVLNSRRASDIMHLVFTAPASP